MKRLLHPRTVGGTLARLFIVALIIWAVLIWWAVQIGQEIFHA